MKTVGQIIKSRRQEKGFSVDQLSQLTKIDAKYISAIEADDYQKLPSETFAKGFIRNLALRLDKSPDELVAVFRRDYRQPQSEKKFFHSRHHRLKFSFLNSQIAFFTLALVVFLGYLGFQFRAILTPPPLSILKPTPDSVLISPFEIEGTTSVDSTILINGDTTAKPDSSGHFLVRYTIPVGETVLEIKATNRFGRTNIDKIPLTIVSQ